MFRSLDVLIRVRLVALDLMTYLKTPRPWPCLAMLACSGMTRVRDLVLLRLPNTEEPSPSTWRVTC